MNKKILTATLCYCLIAAITYGYAYHEEFKLWSRRYPDTGRGSIEGYADIDAFIDAVAWPVYWPLHASKELWKE